MSVAVAAGGHPAVIVASRPRKRKRGWPSAGAMVGMAVLAVWVVCALGAPVLAPRDPNAQQLLQRLLPPMWAEGGRPEFPLGTDQLGRDILSRVIYGARASLVVGLTVVMVAGTLGTTLGVLAGYHRGLTETVVMRTVDLFLAFPFLVLALSLMAVVGPSFTNVILVLGLTGWVPYARTVRAETMVLRRREFVQAAVALGATDARILWRHVRPNIMASILVLSTLEVATAIVAEASLTFLGLGIPPSIPTWGQMLEAGREYVFNAWWLTTIPGVCIFVVVLAINVVGDWLRDVWDPRLRGTR